MIISFENCYNCEERYRVPIDEKGLLKVDGEENYLCYRCRYNSQVKMEDYRTLKKCDNVDCSTNIWVLKKHATNPATCPWCSWNDSEMRNKE